MQSTFKLTGLADYITLTNAMFGTLSIFFLILAVDDTLSDPYSEGLATKYIWASMLCIFVSAVGTSSMALLPAGIPSKSCLAAHSTLCQIAFHSVSHLH